ncbi:BolA protein [Artemisia annua]|uniref:BolA protein n=1 Tax=Artemisia annua TaxID=35608 RepID=A0A2U1KKH7_ARTAN|nr:BolA protein [Artemisia annua]
MAKMMLTRSTNMMTSLCAYTTTHIFRCNTIIRHYHHHQPIVRLIGCQQKKGVAVVIKPLMMNNNVSRRNMGTIGAASGSGVGPIDSPLMQSMQSKIKEELNAELVTVNDAYGDGRHVSIDVVSSAFEGKSAVNRQRMVYKAIWEELQSVVHAVDQMTTKTPEEAASGK